MQGPNRRRLFVMPYAATKALLLAVSVGAKLTTSSVWPAGSTVFGGNV